jgi:ribosomal protein S18 acetylase RimI-like enzyme
MSPADSDTIRAVAGNLRQALSVYGTLPGGAVERFRGLTLVYSTVHYSVFNAAILEEPIVTSTEDLTSRLVTAANWFLRLGAPWSFWFSPTQLSPHVHPMADYLLQQQRLRFISEHLGMRADPLEPPTHRLPPLDVRQVLCPDSRRHFSELTAEVFAVPETVADRVYARDALWKTGDFAGFVGYHEGRPMATAAVSLGDQGVGLYSVSTLFPFRRRGYGERMTRFALDYAADRSRSTSVVLQSTPAGAMLYRRMGFRPAGSLLVYAM